jgi:undecaprenyl-diphosphatase
VNILHAIILSIVEGITEFLPISSTGHMILASDILRIPQNEFLKSFEIIIQFGAILAVVSLYIKVLLTNRAIWVKLLAAFVPTGIVGLVLYKFIKNYLLGNTPVVLWSLFIGGVILILWEKYYQRKKAHVQKIEDLSYRNAFLIGLFQSISVVPGVSRAAATIVGAMTVGLERKAAVEFSFLLAVPTMAAATGLDLVKSNFHFSTSEWGMLAVGFAGAFVTALVSVRYFLRFVEKHTFVPFGVYRMLLALLFWLVIVR